MNQFLLFYSTQFVVLCYSSPRELIQWDYGIHSLVNYVWSGPTLAVSTNRNSHSFGAITLTKALDFILQVGGGGGLRFCCCLGCRGGCLFYCLLVLCGFFGGVFFWYFGCCNILIVLFVCLFLPHWEARGILVHWTGIEPMLLVLEAWSLNHWTTREVPVSCF